MKAIFEIREDDNGNTGFMFQGAPSHFDAVSLDRVSQYYNPASLIVHDLIEHDFKNDSGSVEDELKAIGGAMYGRGKHGTLTVEGIMSDLALMARNSNLFLKPTKKGVKKFEPIEWMIEELKKDMRKVYNYITGELDSDDDISHYDVVRFVKRALCYIRQGARRAHKRFKNSFDMFNMFDKMSREILAVGKITCEYSEQLIVEFCFKKQSFNVYNKSIDNDYY